jgi:ribonucleoside-diphosphate reductase alpha chain
VADTWRRVARALAAVEGGCAAQWEAAFYSILEDFRFLPGGRILAGAGTDRRVTLFNCFVMGPIDDSIEGIFQAIKEGALTMQEGGGVGYDFSTLRPRGSIARATGRIASGPVSFMHVWDASCGAVLSTGARRGAMMATLRCDHPDIETFIEAKREPGALRNFNLSVLVTDEFMRAVAEGGDWPLLFPAHDLQHHAGDHEEVVRRAWPGAPGEVACRILKRVPARRLWAQIMRSTYDFAEPGVLFVDQINRQNNLWYREHITTCNPCGEIPLPPYGACDLGSINLPRFVRSPFSPDAALDMEAIAGTAKTAVRLLDNVIDVSRFPLPAQAEAARGARRIGLGITGLADALLMMGLHYADHRARDMAATTMAAIQHAAYRASIDLAREKGPFPFLDRERYLQGTFIRNQPEDIRAGVAEHGIRNSHLIAIAPTGSISLLAGNVSAGIEPIFDSHHTRWVRDAHGDPHPFEIDDFACALWRRLRGGNCEVPPAFVTALALSPEDHLAMQAALQPYVDGAISKTINVPETFSFSAFEEIYQRAHRLGLKGCTTFRPNPVTGEVLTGHQGGKAEVDDRSCCGIEREGD